jgi:S1-C subfamily serine protease
VRGLRSEPPDALRLRYYLTVRRTGKLAARTISSHIWGVTDFTGPEHEAAAMKTLDELRALYEAMPVDRLRDAVADGEASYRPEAWRIIQEEIQRRRDEGRWPSEYDAEPACTPATEEKRLTGVRGWLAFFVVVVVLGLVVSIVRAFKLIASGEATGDALLLLLWVPVHGYGLHLIFSRDVRAPRYWIVVMVAHAVFGVAAATIVGDVGHFAKSVVAGLVWAMYWTNSRRVHHTFASSPAPAATVAPVAGDLALETNTPSASMPPAAGPSPETIPDRDVAASDRIPEGQFARVDPPPVPTSQDVDTRQRDEPRPVAAGHATRSVLPVSVGRRVVLGVAGFVMLALFLVGTWYIGSSANRASGQTDGGIPANVSGAQTLTPREIAERARAATVQIRALDAGGAVIGQGTGFLLSKHGLIGTNLHVIRRAHALQVEMLSGDTYDQVFYVTADARRDVAILKIPVDDGRPLPLALDSAIAVGEPIYVMGNPLGQTGTFSDGLVSANRMVGGVSLLQMTAPVSPGSSGGPVLNARGEVVGMATFMLWGGQNLNYAVPVRYIRPLLETGEPPRRYSVGLLPRAVGGLSSVGVNERGGAGSARRSRDPTAPRLDDVVGTQFVAADSSIRSVGGELASPIRRGSLESGTSSNQDVVLMQGREYAIVGYCDEGCGNLDMVLSTPTGNVVASDRQADDRPYLLFTAPVSGTYRLRVTMVSCSVAPCGYGVRLYRF